MKLYVFLCYEYCKIKTVVCTFSVVIFLSQLFTSFPLFYIKIGTEQTYQYIKTAILKTRGTIYRNRFRRGTQARKVGNHCSTLLPGNIKIPLSFLL
jgi:hypothetical protein